MGNVQVGHLFKKRTIRKLDGSIHTLQDDTLGGTIISRGNVVNQDAINILAAKEKDRQTAATEATQVGVPESVQEERIAAPSRLDKLEERINGQDSKLDAILAALNGKKA